MTSDVEASARRLRSLGHSAQFVADIYGMNGMAQCTNPDRAQLSGLDRLTIAPPDVMPAEIDAALMQSQQHQPRNAQHQPDPHDD